MIAKYGALGFAALAALVAVARWVGQVETRIANLENARVYYHGPDPLPSDRRP